MNLEFYPPTIQDKTWVNNILKKTYYIRSDAAFGTIYIWSNIFNTKICNYEGNLIESCGIDSIKYIFPFTDKNPKEIINLMISNHKIHNSYVPFIFTGITDKELEYLENEFPNQFEIIPKRNMWEYIYSCKELATLSGKKFHNKRNHINNFKKLYSFEYEKIKKENILDVYKFIDQWFKINGNIEPEKTAIHKCLTYYDELELLGAVIKVNKKIIALTIGEKINDDIFVIHFEKAFKSYVGSYSVINYKFSKILYDLGFKYINREEDLGIPGLRKSKLSYNPVILMKKYDAVLGG